MKEASDEDSMGSTHTSCMECGSETVTLLPAPCQRTSLRSVMKVRGGLCSGMSLTV
jgi:hypothetical protein